jgi:hypothetical protein
MSALIREFGEDCVTFINGDCNAHEVIDSRGRPQCLRIGRAGAADPLNEGWCPLPGLDRGRG